MGCISISGLLRAVMGGGGVLGGCGGVSFLVGLSIIGGVFMLAGGGLGAGLLSMGF